VWGASTRARPGDVSHLSGAGNVELPCGACRCARPGEPTVGRAVRWRSGWLRASRRVGARRPSDRPLLLSTLNPASAGSPPLRLPAPTGGHRGGHQRSLLGRGTQGSCRKWLEMSGCRAVSAVSPAGRPMVRKGSERVRSRVRPVGTAQATVCGQGEARGSEPRCIGGCRPEPASLSLAAADRVGRLWQPDTDANRESPSGRQPSPFDGHASCGTEGGRGAPWDDEAVGVGVGVWAEAASMGDHGGARWPVWDRAIRSLGLTRAGCPRCREGI
jgi:hypothetical protein